MAFKLTFNAPAYKNFLEGETYRGLKVDYTPEGSVRFLPVKERFGAGIIPIRPRQRGGFETLPIEGNGAPALQQALMNELGYPFYILRRGEGGWIETQPWDGPKKLPVSTDGKPVKPEPDRFVPHLRVWASVGLTKTASAATTNFAGPAEKVEAEEDTVEVDVAEVRNMLFRLSNSLGNLSDAPLGKALTNLRSVKELLEQVEQPLIKAAAFEAQVLRGERRVPTRESRDAARTTPRQPSTASKPEPSAPEPTKSTAGRKAQAASAPKAAPVQAAAPSKSAEPKTTQAPAVAPGRPPIPAKLARASTRHQRGFRLSEAVAG